MSSTLNKIQPFLTVITLVVVILGVGFGGYREWGKDLSQRLEDKQRQIELLEKKVKSTKNALNRLYQSIKDGEKWKWSRWVNTPRSIHEENPSKYKVQDIVDKIQLLESLMNEHDLDLEEQHAFAIAKFYFFNKASRDYARSKKHIDNYIKKKRKKNEDVGIDALFVQATVYGLSLLPLDDYKERKCGLEYDPKEAELIITNYKKVIASKKEDNPYYYPAMNNLALLYVCIKKNDQRALNEALKYAHQSVRNEPHDFASLDTMAQVRAAKGDLDEAVDIEISALQKCKASSICASSQIVIGRRLVGLIEKAGNAWATQRKCSNSKIQKIATTISLMDDEVSIEKLRAVKNRIKTECGIKYASVYFVKKDPPGKDYHWHKNCPQLPKDIVSNPAWENKKSKPVDLVACSLCKNKDDAGY